MRIRRPVVIALLCLLALAGVATHAVRHAGSFLERPGGPLGKADAVFVLGGDSGDRVLRAAALYRDGAAGTFVLTGMEDAHPEVLPEVLHWRARVLAKRGVPESAIEFDTLSSNSDEEAAFGLALAKKRGWKRVLVLSDPPHMRRLSIIWGRTFVGSGIDVRYVASKPKWWVPERWWTVRKSAQFVVSEYIKLAYTLL